MKKTFFFAGMLCMGVSAWAQDTTDVFSRHLQLDEVVVTGLAGESKLSETPSAVRVLDVSALKATASGNIIDAIAREPGVNRISTGSGIAKPVIRGLGYNRVVVIADGLRQEGQQWGDEHGVEVDGNGVHSAEIIKGPASLMYGSDALAGVLIFYDSPNPEPGSFQGGISSEYQSNSGLAAYSLYQSGNQNGVVWNLRFSDKYAHAYRNAADGLIPGTQFRERALTGRLGLNRDWGYSRLTLSYYHMTPGMTEGYEDGVLEGPTGYAFELPFQQVRHYKMALDNSFRVGDGQIKVLAGYQLNRRQEFEEAEDEAELDFRLETLNYDLKYISGAHNGWKISTGLGGMYQRSDNLGEEALIPAYRLLDAGIFATATKSLDNWHFSGGLRGDLRFLNSLGSEERFVDFSRRYTGLTGSIGVVYSPLSSLHLRANLARGFRAPNLSELGSNGVHEGTVRYEVGNADLKPEYSLQTDLGADFSTDFLFVSAALFHNRIDNYIFAERNGMIRDGYQEYVYTASDARLYGAEAAVDIHPVHRLHFGADFSFVRGVSGENDLPLIPASTLAGDVRWELTHGRHLLTNAYVAFRAEHHFAQNHFLAGTETATEAYTLLGISAATDIFVRDRRAATLTLLVDNLSDVVYVDHLSRLKYVGLRNPGRNITLKLELPF